MIKPETLLQLAEHHDNILALLTPLALAREQHMRFRWTAELRRVYLNSKGFEDSEFTGREVLSRSAEPDFKKIHDVLVELEAVAEKQKHRQQQKQQQQKRSHLPHLRHFSGVLASFLRFFFAFYCTRLTVVTCAIRYPPQWIQGFRRWCGAGC